MKKQMVVVRLDDATLVWLSGTIGGSLAPPLHEALYGLIAGQTRPLVLDLTEVFAIDEGAISVLAAASMQAGGRGGIEFRLPHGGRCLVKDAATLRHAISSAYPAAA